MEQSIKRICFPNTVGDSDKAHYESPRYFFNRIQKTGDGAMIDWFEVWEGKDQEGCYKTKVCEVKESVCDIYFEAN